MRHYEIALIVHPNQSNQVDVMMDKYKEDIESSGGKVHRRKIGDVNTLLIQSRKSIKLITC